MRAPWKSGVAEAEPVFVVPEEPQPPSQRASEELTSSPPREHYLYDELLPLIDQYVNDEHLSAGRKGNIGKRINEILAAI